MTYLAAVYIAHAVVVAQVDVGTNLTFFGNAVAIFKSCLKDVGLQSL